MSQNPVNSSSDLRFGITLSALTILSVFYWIQSRKIQELEENLPPENLPINQLRRGRIVSRSISAGMDAYVDIVEDETVLPVEEDTISLENIEKPLRREDSVGKFFLEQPGQFAQDSLSDHPESNISQISHATSPHHSWDMIGLEQPLVIATVGLPARGKSYIMKMVLRYLNYTGFECQVFNVGSHRRRKGYKSASSSFFDSSNEEGQRLREKLAQEVQDGMYQWLHSGENEKRRVAVFDATNTTRERRSLLSHRARKEGVALLFVESICDDEEVLQRNYALKLKNEDYRDIDPEKARSDFMRRLREYEKVYETVADDEDNGRISFIKLINVGQKIITRNCQGYLPSYVSFYLQNIHIVPRKIYISIVAESVESRIGSSRVAGLESGRLTEEGEKFCINLAQYVEHEQQTAGSDPSKTFVILTGTGAIHYKTVAELKEMNFDTFHSSLLNELRGGELHGITKEEFSLEHSEEYKKRQSDKLRYRYPGIGGESYIDVMERLRPVIIELERQRRNVVVVCHVAVARCIYAYFMNVALESAPFLKFKSHLIYELVPGPFGCNCNVMDPFDVTSDRHRSPSFSSTSSSSSSSDTSTSSSQ